MVPAPTRQQMQFKAPAPQQRTQATQDAYKIPIRGIFFLLILQKHLKRDFYSNCETAKLDKTCM